MFPIISLGPLSLPSAPLILLIGFWLGSSLAERKFKAAGKDPDQLGKIIWYTLLAGIAGARISFIARDPSAFAGNWKSVLSLNQALLDPVGGLAISLAVLYFLSVQYRVSWKELLDDLVPLFAVFAPAIFLANFASGKGIGLLADLPWGINQYGGARHPVQLYLALSGLIVLYLSSFHRGSVQTQPGSRFLNFLTYTSGYLTFLLGFQDPLGNTLGGLRINQVLAWVVFSGAIYFLYRLNRREVNHAAS